jgi:tripartite-type tricarboxylate transporter receptor subunit TctC
MAKMPFRTPDDFAPVLLLVTVPELLVVTPTFSTKTVAELVAMAKAEPGKLSYASSGNGSAQHLAAELFKLRTGTDIQHLQGRQPGRGRCRRRSRAVPFRQHERGTAPGAGRAG